MSRTLQLCGFLGSSVCAPSAVCAEQQITNAIYLPSARDMRLIRTATQRSQKRRHNEQRTQRVCTGHDERDVVAPRGISETSHAPYFVFILNFNNRRDKCDSQPGNVRVSNQEVRVTPSLSYFEVRNCSFATVAMKI